MPQPRRRTHLVAAAARGDAAKKAEAAPQRTAAGGSVHHPRGHSTSSLRSRGAVVDETAQEITGTERHFGPDEVPAQVKFGAGLTINMGDFNMLRLDVSITIPCRPDEVDEAFQEASDFVADKIGEEEFRWTGIDKRGK